MLENGLCERVIFSDISKGSLQKAQTLLADYVQDGKAVPVLGDGFFGVPSDTEEVLIAGMGGREITLILSDEKYGFLPRRFVFQPMHDAEKLRRYLVAQGAQIERDYTFEDGKFYDVIVGNDGKRGGQVREYSDYDFEFGRDNLKERPEAFLKRTAKLLKDTLRYLERENLQEESVLELTERKRKLEGVLSGEIK
jgi:tRNA (adenine22-N1)-methyltransferase